MDSPCVKAETLLDWERRCSQTRQETQADAPRDREHGPGYNMEQLQLNQLHRQISFWDKL